MSAEEALSMSSASSVRPATQVVEFDLPSASAIESIIHGLLKEYDAELENNETLHRESIRYR